MASCGCRRDNREEAFVRGEKRLANRVYNRLRKRVGGLDPPMSGGCRHDLNFR